MEIVYGKLGAIRVVTSQLGFARPFSIRFFARNVVPTVIWLMEKSFGLRRFDCRTTPADKTTGNKKKNV